MSRNNRIITGLDIGTTKICAIVGQITENGKIEVLGMGKADSFGVMRGVVANIDKTVEAIKLAVADAEQKVVLPFVKFTLVLPDNTLKVYNTAIS